MKRDWPKHRRRPTASVPIRDSLLSKAWPRLCLFGHHHHHAWVTAEIAGVRCVGLNCIGPGGNLVAIELGANSPGWSVIAESPGPPAVVIPAT